MIATVKIAPVERWCQPVMEQMNRLGISPDVLPGTPVAIDTMSKTTEDAVEIPCDIHCGGALWLVTGESTTKLFDIINHPESAPPRTYICEHMLEMD